MTNDELVQYTILDKKSASDLLTVTIGKAIYTDMQTLLDCFGIPDIEINSDRTISIDFYGSVKKLINDNNYSVKEETVSIHLELNNYSPDGEKVLKAIVSVPMVNSKNISYDVISDIISQHDKNYLNIQNDFEENLKKYNDFTSDKHNKNTSSEREGVRHINSFFYKSTKHFEQLLSQENYINILINILNKVSDENITSSEIKWIECFDETKYIISNIINDLNDYKKEIEESPMQLHLSKEIINKIKKDMISLTVDMLSDETKTERWFDKPEESQGFKSFDEDEDDGEICSHLKFAIRDLDKESFVFLVHVAMLSDDNDVKKNILLNIARNMNECGKNEQDIKYIDTVLNHANCLLSIENISTIESTSIQASPARM